MSQEKAVMLGRLEEGLNLLRQYSPVRYQRVTRSIRGFLVFGTGSTRASYDSEVKLCRFGEQFLLAPDTTSASIAATTVHEATHGWLDSLGIGYDERVRHRVEQICIRAALRVAKALPGAYEEVERCERQLSLTADAFSEASFLQHAVQQLRELGVPEWIIRFLVWFRRKRGGKLQSIA